MSWVYALLYLEGWDIGKEMGVVRLVGVVVKCGAWMAGSWISALLRLEGAAVIGLVELMATAFNGGEDLSALY